MKRKFGIVPELLVSEKNMDNISFIVPIEIWDIILDFLDTKSLLNFQHTCHTWRNIILDYAMRGRLRSRALVRILTIFKTESFF